MALTTLMPESNFSLLWNSLLLPVVVLFAAAAAAADR